MVVRIVIQARTTSSRLPAKVLLPLGGYPVVVLCALRASRSGHEVVVATSDRSDDDIVHRKVTAAGVDVVRGPLEDTLARFVLAADGLADDDIIVRLTADNVAPDADLIDQLIGALDESTPYVRVGGADAALPYGVSAEAFTVDILRRAAREADVPFDREHVTPWIRRHSSDQQFRPLELSLLWQGRRCTIDCLDDYLLMSRVIDELEDPVAAPWTQIVDLIPSASPVILDLTLGTVQLGMDYGVANQTGMPSSEDAVELLRSAAAAGITTFDTARAYGLSEERIGIALRRGLGESTRVVTKLQPMDAVGEDWPATAVRAAVQVSVERSRRALGLEHLPVLLTHRSRDWFIVGVRDQLCEYLDSNTIGRVGVSLSTPDELLCVLEDPIVSYVQLPFNLMDDRWLTEQVQGALAARADVTVAVRSVFLQGLLTLQSARWPSNSPLSEPLVRTTLEDLIERFERESAVDLAMAYVRSFDWIDTLVLGAETPQQVSEQALLAQLPPLTLDQQRIARSSLAPRAGRLVDPSTWEHYGPL